MQGKANPLISGLAAGNLQPQPHNEPHTGYVSSGGIKHPKPLRLELAPQTAGGFAGHGNIGLIKIRVNQDTDPWILLPSQYLFKPVKVIHESGDLHLRAYFDFIGSKLSLFLAHNLEVLQVTGGMAEHLVPAYLKVFHHCL